MTDHHEGESILSDSGIRGGGGGEIWKNGLSPKALPRVMCLMKRVK